MFILVGVLTLCVMSVNAVPKLTPLSGDVEHVTVNEIKTGRVRAERSVEDCHFPHTLHFTFRVQGEKIILNLEKNVYLSRSAPIYITNNGRSYRDETVNTNEFAVYQDLSRGSAMLVSCQDDGTFRLHGSFRHNGVQYQMSHSNVPEPSPHHYIQRTHSSNSTFKNDGVLPSQEVIDELHMLGKSSRQKREDPQIPGGNIVELLFTVDKAFYDEFKATQGTDEAAKAAIQLYAALLANEIDLHYCSVDMVDPSLSIKIYLAGVEIPEVGFDVSWSTASQENVGGVTYISISKILTKMKTWLAGESGLPQHDHLMALTAMELADITNGNADTGVLGYAYVGTVCSSTSKVSVTEIARQRVGLIAAHELGHGLNAYHDSGACPAETKNTMSAYVSLLTSSTYAEAQWTFSGCSVAAFKSFIDGLGGNNCLQQHAFSGSEFADLQAKSLPGTVYSLDQQCQIYNGVWSTACFSTISESACYEGFQCSTSSDLPAGCFTGFYGLYPFAGTPCGAPEDNKWCYRGQCVQKSTIATTTTSTTNSPTTSTTTPTTSSTSSTTICTTSSTSTTPATTSTTSTSQTTSTTSPTTSSTPSTTSSTSPTPATTSTTSTSQTTPTTSPTTSSTPSTTSSTSTTPATTSTTSTSQTTSTTSPTTSSTSSATSTSPTTSTTTKTTSSTTNPPTTSTTTLKPCNEKQKCCVKVGKKKQCCKGTKCCKASLTWAVETECYKSCCSTTGTTSSTSSTTTSTKTSTTSSTTSPPTTSTTTPKPCNKKQKCCVKVGKKKKCCKGTKCCKASLTWAVETECYKSCCSTIGTTPTPCFTGKCCTKVQTGNKLKKVCCKKTDCCKLGTWGVNTECCTTCK